ncbi:MAG: APC family permease [Phycisphaerae bacterium]
MTDARAGQDHPVCIARNRDRVSNSAPNLARRVTAFTAACVIISNMIGTGIFGTTGFIARDLGHPVVILLVWILGGGLAFLGALCYCELGAAMPRAGGEYIYIREAYGPLLGFLSGWMSLTIGFSAAIATNAHLFAIHARELLPDVFSHAGMHGGWGHYVLHPRSIALAMVWTLTIVHVAGVGAGGFVQRVLTIAKVGAIVLLIAAGVLVGKGQFGRVISGDSTPQFSLSAVLVSLLFVSFSYSGWNAAGYIAGEMEEPRTSIPRATLWGTGCVAVLYLGLNLLYVYALPISTLAADPIEPVAHKSAAAMFGDGAGRWVTAMLSVSILGAASAMIWAGPRVYYSMSRDGVFPAAFGRTTSRASSPVQSIVLQSVWVSILVMSGTFETLLLYAGFVLVVFTGLAVGAVIVLRIRRPDLERPYRVRPYPLVPVAYLAISLTIMWAAFVVRPMESVLGVATVLTGVPWYFYWKRKNAACVETGAAGKA